MRRAGLLAWADLLNSPSINVTPILSPRNSSSLSYIPKSNQRVALTKAQLPTVEARKLEYDHPPTPKPRKEGKPAQNVPDPNSNFLEPTVGLPSMDLLSRPRCIERTAGPWYLEAQGSYNQAITVLMTQLQPGQLY